MVGTTRIVRQGKSSLGCQGLAPARAQGSGGIQPADGWAWFQGWHTFGQGLGRHALVLGGLRGGKAPAGASERRR
jgi:hypothetical protein